MSEEIKFNLILKNIREAGFVTDDYKMEMTKVLGSRFTAAYEAMEARKVRRYSFYPSGRVVWIVAGKERDYQILPLANFCTCFDFYFRVINHEISFCYHLIAQKLSEALGKYVIIEEPDTSFMPLMEKLGEDLGRKRVLSIIEVENVRKITIDVLLEGRELTTERLLEEVKGAGFKLTAKHLANILVADKSKRFRHIDGLWVLASSVNVK